MFKKILVFVTLITCLNNAAQTDPHDILGISKDASRKQIDKRCRTLLAQHHPDKGGTTDDFTTIGNACDTLKYGEDTSTPATPSSKKSTSNPFADFFKYEGGYTFYTFDNKGFHRSFHSDNHQQTHTNSDGCSSLHDFCVCSNTLSLGTCVRGPLKQGLYCSCPKPAHDHEDYFTSSGQSGKKSSRTFSGEDKSPKFSYASPEDDKENSHYSHYDDFDYSDFFETPGTSKRSPFSKEELHVFLVPRTIQSPLFNLPLERGLTPSPAQWGEGFRLFCALVPFGQTEETLFEGQWREHQAGVLLDIHFIFGKLYFQSKTLLAQREASFTSHDYSFSHSSSFAPKEGLAAIGIHTALFRDEDYFDIKGLVGNTSSWLKNFNVAPEGKAFAFDLPHFCLGLQADAHLGLAEFQASSHKAILNARWLHFFIPNPDMDSKFLKQSHHGDDLRFKQAEDFANILVSRALQPANAFDLLIGFDNQFGMCRQHHIEFGYNPMFYTAEDSEGYPETFEYSIATFVLHKAQPSINHTVYVSYTYDIPIKDNLLSLGIGYQSTFCSHEVLLDRIRHIFWGSLSYAF